MARIKGIDIPNDKRIEISLTYIYGIGRKLSKQILTLLNLLINLIKNQKQKMQLFGKMLLIDLEGLTEELQKLIYQILQGMQMLMKLF